MTFDQQAVNSFVNLHNINEVLVSKNFDGSMSSQLNDIRNYNLDINGMSIYKANGMIYTSRSYYSAEFWNDFLKNEFFTYPDALNKRNTWLLLENQNQETIAPTADPEILLNVITFCNSSNQLLGYLIADVSLDSIASSYISDSNIFLKNAIIYIDAGQNSPLPVYVQNKNTKTKQVLPHQLPKTDGYTLINDNKNMLVTQSIANSNLRILVFLPLDFIQNQLKLLKAFFIICGLIFTFLSIPFISLLINSITTPINKSYFKIRSYLKSNHC